jgi:hypothetical protein
MIRPPTNILDLDLEERALMALQAAVENVIEEHAREGIAAIYLARRSSRCGSCRRIAQAFLK